MNKLAFLVLGWEVEGCWGGGENWIFILFIREVMRLGIRILEECGVLGRISGICAIFYMVVSSNSEFDRLSANEKFQSNRVCA